MSKGKIIKKLVSATKYELEELISRLMPKSWQSKRRKEVLAIRNELEQLFSNYLIIPKEGKLARPNDIFDLEIPDTPNFEPKIFFRPYYYPPYHKEYDIITPVNFKYGLLYLGFGVKEIKSVYHRKIDGIKLTLCDAEGSQLKPKRQARIYDQLAMFEDIDLRKSYTIKVS